MERRWDRSPTGSEASAARRLRIRSCRAPPTTTRVSRHHCPPGSRQIGGKYTSPLTLSSQTAASTRAPRTSLFLRLHFTLQGAVPTVTGAISASRFRRVPDVRPGSWIEIYGTNLGADTQGWGSSDFNGVLAPNNTRWNFGDIGGQSAFVDYISSTQVNVQVPNGVALRHQPLVSPPR